MESKIEDLNTEITFHKAAIHSRDILDPDSHRELLHLTGLVARQLLEEQRAELAEAFDHKHNEDVKQVMLAMAHTSSSIDRAKDGFTSAYQYQHLDDFKRIQEHRTEIMDDRFQKYLTAEHPDLTDPSPSGPGFQEAFRTFAKDYLEGDVHTLALRYAGSAASTSNSGEEERNTHMAIYEHLTAKHQEHEEARTSSSYREMLTG